jgi:hypothetical protein
MAVATLAVWVMTLFIQRSNRRDTLALHAKLDELLRVDTPFGTAPPLDEQEPPLKFSVLAQPDQIRVFFRHRRASHRSACLRRRAAMLLQ